MPAGVSAWTPLANITLSGSASTVTFSSISGSYRDLVVVSFINTATGSGYFRIRFNSDTGNNYNRVNASGDGAGSLSSYATTSANGLTLAEYALMGASYRPQFITHILDYSATDKHKTVISRGDNAATGTEMICGRWANTAAITTIQLLDQSGNSFAAGSTFALYGVSA